MTSLLAEISEAATVPLSTAVMMLSGAAGTGFGAAMTAFAMLRRYNKALRALFGDAETGELGLVKIVAGLEACAKLQHQRIEAMKTHLTGDDENVPLARFWPESNKTTKRITDHH